MNLRYQFYPRYDWPWYYRIIDKDYNIISHVFGFGYWQFIYYQVLN